MSRAFAPGRCRRASAAAPLLALLALPLGACDRLMPGGDGAPLAIQLLHSGGAVIQLQRLRASGSAAEVRLRAINGGTVEMTFNAMRDDTFILSDNGAKLPLVVAQGAQRLAIPAGQMAEVDLVFAGAFPRSGHATLIINQSGQRDASYAPQPRFEAALPVEGVSGGGIAAASALAAMQPVPQSRLRLVPGGGSALGAGAAAQSALHPIEQLKSSLGAVATARGLLVSLPGDVTFDYDKATIRADATATLDRLAELISAGAGAGPIGIEGHTDSKGTDAYNQTLSAARAAAVKAYLVGKGIAAARLNAAGFGKRRPLVPNTRPDGSDDPAARQKNRRVEVVLPDGTRPAASPQPPG